MARSSMPRIISIARSSPTRSSVFRCCDTSAASRADLAVSVAIWRSHLSSLSVRRPGSPGGACPGARDLRVGRGLTVLMSVRHAPLGLTATMVESVWRSRLRWRMRGAWQWPTFAVLMVVDAVLIARLPFHGDGPDALGAILLAGFFNLLVVGVFAPLLGVLVRRRRRDLPFVVARDYAGTGLLLAATGALVAGGLAHRSALAAEHADLAAVQLGVHDYVVTQSPRFEGGLAAPDVVRLEPDHY